LHVEVAKPGMAQGC